MVASATSTVIDGSIVAVFYCIVDAMPSMNNGPQDGKYGFVSHVATGDGLGTERDNERSTSRRAVAVLSGRFLGMLDACQERSGSSNGSRNHLRA